MRDVDASDGLARGDGDHGVVIVLMFLSGFGNVLDLALRPSLLAAVTAVTTSSGTACPPIAQPTVGSGDEQERDYVVVVDDTSLCQTSLGLDDDLLERARQEDRRHREVCVRPISADMLRKRLRIGSARSRSLVALLWSEARLELRSVDEVAQPAGQEQTG